MRQALVSETLQMCIKHSAFKHHCNYICRMRGQWEVRIANVCKKSDDLGRYPEHLGFQFERWVFIGKTHFLDSLQTVWSGNTPLFKDLNAFSCMEKQHFRNCVIPPLSAAKDTVPGKGASPGRQLSRTSVALLALPAGGQQSLDGPWVCKSSGVGCSYQEFISFSSILLKARKKACVGKSSCSPFLSQPPPSGFVSASRRQSC